ncbi:hypothetical protein GHK86_17515 [Acidimicrobiaceae bacterium USS-CC1]|uniref:DUF5615 domain-containing protein n=1 Tax=Acidiferrimicrobium australe TaxID=2664430 RepID=A0ABW9QZ60_9ACTN|nr:hypothetical protein [Acidiferrimicrobium australe]
MRLLVDESLSTTVAALLRDGGHDAVHLTDLGLLGAPDPVVMAAAGDASRVLVSADTDFGELLAVGRHPGPSVVLLRRAPKRPELQARLLLTALGQVEAELTAGAVAVISPGWVRVRRLPVEPPG